MTSRSKDIGIFVLLLYNIFYISMANSTFTVLCYNIIYLFLNIIYGIWYNKYRCYRFLGIWRIGIHINNITWFNIILSFLLQFTSGGIWYLRIIIVILHWTFFIRSFYLIFELKIADWSTHTIQILIINRRKHNFTSLIYCSFVIIEHASILPINRQVCNVVFEYYNKLWYSRIQYGEKRRKFVCL